MKFISICSGIEAASVAFNTLGWEAVAFSEIEPFPCALLAHHYPDVPNFGDMTKFREWPEEVFTQADMIVGGPPCQSFSVAGKRQGLNDDRGNLTLIYTELIEHADTIRLKHGKPPVIVIYENVPGLLSDKTGAFGCFLGALAGEDCELQSPGQRWTNAGYVLGPQRAVAWRVLDAQYFGLAQRRKRVFVVASAREDICPAEILFEFDGVRRDTAPSRETRKETAGNVGEGFTPSSFGGYREGVGTLRAAGGDLGGGSETLSVGKWPSDIASTNQTGFRKLTFESYAQDETASTMMARDYKSYTDLVSFNSHQDPVSGDVFGTLNTSSPQAQAVTVYPINTMTMLGRPSDDLKPRMGLGIGGEFDLQNTLSAAHCHAIGTQAAVRRLTPIECERLQGFQDGYTMIPWRGKPAGDCPDGHRYKALGNSMAVPVMRWLGERINAFLP